MDKKNIKIIKFDKKFNKNLNLNNTKINIEKLQPNVLVEFSDNDSDNESIDLFAENSEIEVETQEVIPEYEKIFDNDLIYEKDLENDLIKSLPIYKQDSLFEKENINKKIKKIIKLKNLGIEILNRDDDYYKVIDDYQNSNFSQKWIIPVSVDKQINYTSKIEEKDCEECDKDSIKLRNFFKNLKISTNILHQIQLDKIKYTEYIKQSSNIIKPYVYQNINNGYYTSLKNDTTILSKYNINNIYWNTYKSLGPLSFHYKSIEDTETKYVNILPSDKINIIGFLIIPDAHDTILKSQNSIDGKYTQQFGKIADITNISNSIITAKNHGLNKTVKYYISIKNSNSVPSIDGNYPILTQENVFKNKINIIDDNKLSVGINVNEVGDNGDLFGPLKLNFETNKLKTSDTKFDKKIHNNTKTKLFNFENNKIISKEEYKKLVKQIIPSIDNILYISYNQINKYANIDKINDFLDKYDIQVNDLKLYQLNVIKEILEKNIEKYISNLESKKESKSNSEQDTPKILYDLLQNKDFFSDKIKKYYSPYSKDNDSILKRFSWIINQYDNGDLYINQYLLDNNKSNLKYIEDKIKILQNQFNNVKKQYDSEEKKNKLDICKNYDDNNYDGKYTLEQYCNLQGIKNINNLSFDKLVCLYKSNKCSSKKIVNLFNRVKKLEQILNNYKNIQQDIKSNKYINEIKLKINNSQKLLEFQDLAPFSKNNNIESEIEIKTPVEYDSNSYRLYQNILKIRNNDIKRQLIYKLINTDGLLINNFYYSKKYKHKLLCGHWQYYYKIDTNDGNDSTLFEKMVSIYGDDGSAMNGIISCNTCGNVLINDEFDEAEGFDQYGKQKRSREIAEIDTTRISCNDLNNPDFKSLLEKSGLDIVVNNSDKIKKICSILDMMCLKIGINLENDDFIKSIKESLKLVNFRNIQTFEQYKKIFIKKVGVDKTKKILIKQPKYIKNEYDLFYDINIYTIIAASLLVKIQISCDKYFSKKAFTSCTFTGFYGNDGPSYMICVIMELLSIKGKKKERKEENVKIKFNNAYRFFIGSPVIKDNIEKCYNKLLQKNTEENNIWSKKQDMRVEMKKYDKIDEKIISIIQNGNFNITIKYRDDIMKRIKYLNYSLKKMIFDVVNNSKIYNEFDIIKSCCIRDINEKQSYDDYVDIEMKGEYYDIIKELELLQKYDNLFLKYDTISRILITKKADYITANTGISIYGANLSDKSISNIFREKFIIYCNRGYSSGEFHNFIKLENNLEKCTKCGDVKTELENSNYDEKMFNNLLTNIKLKNISYYDKPKISNLISDLKSLKESTNELNTEKKIFISRLSGILEKSKDTFFVNKYKNILDNLRMYDNYEDIKYENRKDIILSENIKNRTKIQAYKSYINQYFRKYISIIANYYNKNEYLEEVLFLGETDTKDVQKVITEKNNNINKFISHNYSELFQKMKFTYTIDEINNINGDIDIYDCSYTKIIKKSNINLKNAADILLFILLRNLNQFMLQNGKTKHGINNDKIVCEFIITVFDIIIEDNKKYDIKKDKIDTYMNYLQYNYFIQQQIKYEKMTMERKKLHDIHDKYDDDDNTIEILDRKDMKIALKEQNGVDNEDIDDYVQDVDRDDYLDEVVTQMEGDEEVEMDDYDDHDIDD